MQNTIPGADSGPAAAPREGNQARMSLQPILPPAGIDPPGPQAPEAATAASTAWTRAGVAHSAATRSRRSRASPMTDPARIAPKPIARARATRLGTARPRPQGGPGGLAERRPHAPWLPGSEKAGVHLVDSKTCRMVNQGKTAPFFLFSPGLTEILNVLWYNTK